MCEGRRDRSALPALFARRSCAEPLLFLNAELRAARYRIAREAPEPCSRPPAPPVFSRSGSLWTRCSPLLFPSSPLCFIISARAWVCQAVEREMWGNVVMVDGYCSFCACANCICIPSWVINRDSTSAPLACANCIGKSIQCFSAEWSNVAMRFESSQLHFISVSTIAGSVCNE